jgi:hypothetical protein
MNIDQLILAFGTILLVARVVGWVFQRIGQPRVIGEMTAGILLVPPFSGAFFPQLFTSSSLVFLPCDYRSQLNSFHERQRHCRIRRWRVCLRSLTGAAYGKCRMARPVMAEQSLENWNYLSLTTGGVLRTPSPFGVV